MQQDRGRDDEAWRSIIENYGERVELDDEPPASGPVVSPAPRPEPVPARPVEPAGGLDEADEVDEVDRFVAPDPPLPPRPTRDRLAAWIGVIGSPVVLLVLVLTGLSIPTLLAYALVAGFIGGFGYLVLHLPRSPEDPWDDGARL